MKKGITFGAFDLFHAGHVLMIQEAKRMCDHLIVGIQTDPSFDRSEKSKPVQSIFERVIQVSACRYVDETIVYDTEAHVLQILRSLQWNVRILGDEYRHKDFTGREETLERCYFNKRPHTFSSSELRARVAEIATLKS
jgi:glycerol-3-phosphate cytidylyltransferase